jgi:hypothetical protein
MSQPRAEAAAVRLQDGRVLVLGGFTSNLVVLNSAEVYVPSPAAPARP